MWLAGSVVIVNCFPKLGTRAEYTESAERNGKYVCACMCKLVNIPKKLCVCLYKSEPQILED